ncbi:peptidase M23-like protein [Luteibacter rhizovicinus]|uniref:Peptidase M23-like protein n=1 Tax=Luteibacter rhizovicinus TaxID=242606 RepID=A0A4R3YX47_9GAMM|nr:M23 family metallopeptidase [Luteibacter rhizovicinus]TCV96408.1 peptidase M23-like protein [Luteibacter rhizovicinus]
MIRLIAALVVCMSSLPGLTFAQEALAPVEARVPFAPSPFVGSDGATHLAYELHITNFYGDTGPLKPSTVLVFGDDATQPLLKLDQAAVSGLIRPAPAEGASASIPPGKRGVIYLWITLPQGAAIPKVLHHRVEFGTDKNGVAILDGVRVPVSENKVQTIGAPLRGGRWLAHEGPGASGSHHWGSLVAVNGDLTIPQRYALDLVGVDDSGRAIRKGVANIQKTVYADWIGYGADVIAVADGTVVGARDGEEEHAPLTGQPEPASLTANGLFGNYVILKIGPDTFADYAHLQRGSVKVKVGDRVSKGQVLAHLGQSGNSAAPHLHFQLANAATFEGSEGIPYVFESYDFYGPEVEAQLFGTGDAWKSDKPQPRHGQLPLNDVVIRFPKN